MMDFSPSSSADEYSNFFEVKTFNFDIQATPQDSNQGAYSKLTAANKGINRRPTAQADEFVRWRSATHAEALDMHFPVEFNEFTITRLLDAASMPFFEACCNSVSFYDAALVKRLSVGTGMGDNALRPMGYLRFDFRDVLITGIDWSDGDLVTEECKFICRAMRVRYKQQNADGSLGASTKPAVWPRPDPSDPFSILEEVMEMVQEFWNV